jgi:hypothetical protein
MKIIMLMTINDFVDQQKKWLSFWRTGLAIVYLHHHRHEKDIQAEHQFATKIYSEPELN